MPQVNHVSHVNHANHVTHLSPIGAVPQISPVASYTQLSAAKHLEPHQVPTIGPPTASYSSQTHAPYAPMAAYHLPAGAPYEQHVQTIISNKPYHAAVKHIEPHLNSIVPVHSIPSVTAYNPLSSAASYAQMSSVNPYEHIQTIVKPYPTYPVYIKEEQQHAPTYAVEQPPSPPPPPSYVPSNFWHPDALVYNKPAFTYPNSPGTYFQIDFNWMMNLYFSNICSCVVYFQTLSIHSTIPIQSSPFRQFNLFRMCLNIISWKRSTRRELFQRLVRIFGPPHLEMGAA